MDYKIEEVLGISDDIDVIYDYGEADEVIEYEYEDILEFLKDE